MLNRRMQILSELFKQLPGIGPRQAKRFVYHFLRSEPAYTKQVLRALENLVAEVRQCSSCYRFFELADGSSAEVCQLCLNGSREDTTLLVIEKDIDLEAIEKTGLYHGRYFVLGGLLPLAGKTGGQIRSRELLAKIRQEAATGQLHEVIFALSANLEGDVTYDYLREQISPLAEKYHFQISLLGRGLSTGSELEYADSATIKHALTTRANSSSTKN